MRAWNVNEGGERKLFLFMTCSLIWCKRSHRVGNKSGQMLKKIHFSTPQKICIWRLIRQKALIYLCSLREQTFRAVTSWLPLPRSLFLSLSCFLFSSRCFAALGDVSTLRFLHHTNQIADKVSQDMVRFISTAARLHACRVYVRQRALRAALIVAEYLYFTLVFNRCTFGYLSTSNFKGIKL